MPNRQKILLFVAHELAKFITFHQQISIQNTYQAVNNMVTYDEFQWILQYLKQKGLINQVGYMLYSRAPCSCQQNQ